MRDSKVNANYTILGIFKDVLINFPGKRDSMRFITRHSFKTPDGKKVIVSTHYKKELFYNKKIVIVNFFIFPELRGQKIVVDEVKIVEKNDHARGVKTIIIDITLNGFSGKKVVPKTRLSIGCPMGKFKIPGAPGHYIDFKEIKVKKTIKV